jgi:hypothetical protein
LPAYPFVLSLAYRTGWSQSALVLHALLSVAAVLLLVGISDSLGFSRRWMTVAAVAGALSLPWVSMGGGTMSENLAVPATLSAVYVGLFVRVHRWTRLILLTLAGTVAILCRPELVPILAFIAAVSAARWSYGWQIGLLAVVLVCPVWM